MLYKARNPIAAFIKAGLVVKFISHVVPLHKASDTNFGKHIALLHVKAKYPTAVYLDNNDVGILAGSTSVQLAGDRSGRFAAEEILFAAHV